MNLRQIVMNFIGKRMLYVWSVYFSHNIIIEQQREALISTEKFVSLNLKDIESVSSKEKLWDIAIQNCQSNEGLILEFGVYKGESINYIARRLPKDLIYGFDSFEGLPEFWRNGLPKGSFKIENITKIKLR
jgi:hypothetical protein